MEDARCRRNLVVVIDRRITINPVVVVTGVNSQLRVHHPINRRGKDARLNIHTKVVERHARDLGWAGVVFRDDSKVERDFAV